MKLSEIAVLCKGQLLGNDATIIKGCIDSRNLQPGDLFVALKGEKTDGHAFLDSAYRAGAGGALVNQPVKTELSTVQVPDTLKALQQIAVHLRNQKHIPCVAVTGSCGKTTTRALLESIFSLSGNTLASEKSYNNEIGVALTLMHLTKHYQYLICELGANHANEIAQLTKWVKPDAAIITNAGPAHLAGFGSLDGVARAKGEIFQGLSPQGSAIINQDDVYADFWKNLVRNRKLLTFSTRPHTADVTAKDIQQGALGATSFTLCIFGHEIRVSLSLIGIHNVSNALAAAAAAYSQNISIAHIHQGLESCKPENRRLIEKPAYQNSKLIDDSYNANPLSVKAAIHVLAKRPGKRFLILGDMLELGEQSHAFHKEIGLEAQRSGIDYLFCYGNFSAAAVEAFGNDAYFFQDQALLIQAVKNQLDQETANTSTLLVKGSLGMNMINIVTALSTT
jgi:UDP-N-acetylmuramoyl-tripeptide--D-alanyl-D-alanine ligase